MTTYISRKWLNKDESPSTGSVVSYHGPSPWNTEQLTLFFEVSDCHHSARLHRTELDSIGDFVNKLRTLATEANSFADWLEENRSTIESNLSES